MIVKEFELIKEQVSHVYRRGFLVETALGPVAPDGHLIDRIPRGYRFFMV